MKRAKQHKISVPKPRNPVARSPLMKKGGPHQKSASSMRQRARAELARTIRDLSDA
jgi:hypothetical protein